MPEHSVVHAVMVSEVSARSGEVLSWLDVRPTGIDVCRNGKGCRSLGLVGLG